MTEGPKLRTVRLTRIFDAPIELVFQAWTDPLHVTRWMKCEQEVELTVNGWVAETGAAFTTKMEKPGAWSVTSTGRFLEVDPPRLLAYKTDANPELGTPGLTVRVKLEEVADGTLLTLTHTGIPNDDLCGILETGWTASLAAMDSILTGMGAR